MSEFSQPTNLLCLSCGNLLSREEVVDTCPRCASKIDVDDLLHLYEYAAHVYYYGYQYRQVYEKQQWPEHQVRYSIEFAGEGFAWTMLAILSGIFGNAAYDLVKVVVANISAAVTNGRIPDRDYSALLALSDKELCDLLSSAKSYTNNMDGLTREVRLAIIEEIAVDAMDHQPELMMQMLKLMKGGEISAKKKRKFIKLLKITVAQEHRRIRPKTGSLSDCWTRIEPR